jgi:hypothetical protein
VALALDGRHTQVFPVMSDARVGLDRKVVRTDRLRTHCDVRFASFHRVLVSIVDKGIEEDPEDLEMLLACLQFVDHLVSLVERDVLLSTEVKECLIRLLELELVSSADSFLIKISRV